jgi:NAD(P)-dependent dehydrogenase (short-subunit alcohol dehydrogenase family)
MSTNSEYANKTVLVTGAGTGIGFACAREFAAAGATVTLMGHLAEQIEPAAAQLTTLFGAEFIRAAIGDITVEADLIRAVQIAGNDGQLDIAIANAGSAAPGPILLLETDHWNYANTLNITGTALTIKQAALAMKKRGGRIITISSAAGSKAAKWMATYSASKAAVEMLTRCAAIELAPFKINVNCISPGWIKTEATAMSFSPGLNEQLIHHTLLGDGAEPKVIADGALYLCGERGAFVTGEVLGIGGGMHVAAGEDFIDLVKMMYGDEAIRACEGPLT